MAEWKETVEDRLARLETLLRRSTPDEYPARAMLEDGKLRDAIDRSSKTWKVFPIGLYEDVGAVAAHVAAANPHPTYLTEAEGDALYSALGSSNTLTFTTASLDVNQTNTDVGTFTGLPAKYNVVRFIGHSPTGTPASALAGLFTSTGGGGNEIVTPIACTGLATADAVKHFSVAGAATLLSFTASTLYVRVSTAAGAAATVKFLVEVIELP